jgi:hypothetical protein
MHTFPLTIRNLDNSLTPFSLLRDLLMKTSNQRSKPMLKFLKLTTPTQSEIYVRKSTDYRRNCERLRATKPTRPLKRPKWRIFSSNALKTLGRRFSREGSKTRCKLVKERANLSTIHFRWRMNKPLRSLRNHSRNLPHSQKVRSGMRTLLGRTNSTYWISLSIIKKP